MNLKKSKSQDCNYFEDLPDELLIVIFTKLSSADGLNTVQDIKSLGQCSIVSKRFNSLTYLVPTPTISHTSISRLQKCCSKILNKFKHIRSLLVQYAASTKGVNSDLDPVFRIVSKATYKPHRYSLAVISFSAFDIYVDGHKHHPDARTVTYASRPERQLYASTACYSLALFHLHHLLVSSIRDHKMLLSVIVEDFNTRQNFTLVEEQLLELRNIDSDNVQVEGSEKTGFIDIMNLPLSEDTGLLLKNVCFSFMEKWTSSTHSTNKGNVIPQFDHGSLTPFGDALESLLAMEDIRVALQVVPEMVFVNNWY